MVVVVVVVIVVFDVVILVLMLFLFVVKPLNSGSCPTRTRAADLLSPGQEIRLLVQRFRPKGGSAPLERMQEWEGCLCSELGCLLAHPSCILGAVGAKNINV